MPAKTKSPPQTTPHPDIVGQVLQQRAALFDAAEVILRSTPYTGKIDDDFTAEQRSVMDGLGWDETTTRREHKRARRAVELEQAAGSRAELARAQKAAAKAAESRDTRTPELREQIEALERQIADLAASAARTADDVARRETAREALRDPKLLPPALRENYRRNHQALLSRYHPTISSIESDIRHCVDVQTTSADDTSVPHVLARARGLAVQQTPGAAPAAMWKQYQDAAAGRRLDLEASLAEIKAESDPLFAEVDRVLDFYLDALG